VLATRLGVAAADAAVDGAFGTMTALRAGDIVRIPLEEAVGHLKTLDEDLWRTARVFFA
jgi:6-phosphofructokinase 1